MGEHTLPGQEPDAPGDPAWLVRLRAIATPGRRWAAYQALKAIGALLVFRGVVAADELDLWLNIGLGVLVAGGGQLASSHTERGTS